MSEKTLFMFGGGVSLLVLSGVFFYAMASFSAWSQRDGDTAKQKPVVND